MCFISYQEVLLKMGNLVPGVINKSSNLFASTSKADYITT